MEPAAYVGIQKKARRTFSIAFLDKILDMDSDNGPEEARFSFRVFL
jgi:hypothetical protein